MYHSLLAILAVAPLAAPVPKVPAKTEMYFPTKVGAKWVYVYEFKGLCGSNQEQTDEVTAVEKKGGVFWVTVRQDVHGLPNSVSQFTVSGDGVTVSGRGGRMLPDPYPWVKLPAAAGDTWEICHSEPDGKPGTRTTVYTVGTAEKVLTPAGLFTTIPVQFKKAQFGGTMWHAPGVGPVKAVIGSGGLEVTMTLKSFIPGK
ncbi:hypothetical protein [Limnoglobus roseus]|uniref:Uncharacterized protein n=1 Tax=Limnoglobus roseus TaxID=2598579 RepID=A0A5C1A758_9BACT|nr:hypothetical protein [Limnoglobus roseus]QEL14255.1 hypothetical protein PX52LOC_01125 [Limnoglobus roseus]